MMEEILVCENLTMTFDDGEYIVHALKNVSFSLRKNEVLGIIGESGSGKSTIAKLITGLYQPTGGNIFLGGRSIVRLKRQAQKEVYTKVQMVFQDAVGSFNPRRKLVSLFQIRSAVSAEKISIRPVRKRPFFWMMWDSPGIMRKNIPMSFPAANASVRR